MHEAVESEAEDSVVGALDGSSEVVEPGCELLGPIHTPPRGSNGSIEPHTLARAPPERGAVRLAGRLREEGSAITTPHRTRFAVDRTASAVLVEARSNVGGVSFGSTDISGVIEAVRHGDSVDTNAKPCASLTVPLASLTSGNALYDAELQQRLAVQRHPLVAIELLEATLVADSDYRVRGTVTIHGVTVTLTGRLGLAFPEPDTVLITGEHIIDIRDFDIDLPSVLMLRIYPDVKVSLQLLAREAVAAQEET